MVICHLLGLRLASGRPIFAQITCVILVGSNGYCHLLGLRLASGRPIFAQITCVILVGSNGYLSFARLTPRKWPTHFSPVPLWVVGSNGLEPSTSRLSGVCSNQLSYEPIF